MLLLPTTNMKSYTKKILEKLYQPPKSNVAHALIYYKI